MNIIEFMLKAIEENTVLKVIYHGGSKAGSERTIIPRSLNKTVLTAVTPPEKRTKSFSLKKMEVLDDNNQIIQFTDFVEQEQKEKLTLKDIYHTYKETLEGLGWQVLLSEVYDENEKLRQYICLYDSFKNGKPKQKPSVLIYSSESKHRPHGVGSIRMDTRTYSSLENAFSLFLDEAKNCEIKNPKIKLIKETVLLD